MGSSRRSRVSHRTRKPVSTFVAALVTVRLRDELPRMRTRYTYRVIERALNAGKDRFGFRLLHFSVLSNHMHFVVQAENRRAFSRGMQGLSIRIAKALNCTWKRRGSVFADRYHDRVLQTSHQIRRAIRYVLQNARRHGIRLPAGLPDPFSSGPWFKNWHGRRGQTFSDRRQPVVEPIDMLFFQIRHLSVGLDELPGPSPNWIPL